MGTAKPLEILVFGAGAVGAYIGGSLALDGHRVVFVEREEVAAEISKTGISIRAERGETRSLPPSSFRVASSPEEGLAKGPFDAAVVALKSFDVPSLIASLEPAHDRLGDLPVLCLSNGVDNEPALARALGARRVVAGTLMTAVGRRAAGDVAVEKLRGSGVAASHPVSSPLACAMNDAGLNTRLYPRADDMKWSKLLTNLLGNATSAILDMSPAEIFADPGLCRLEVAQLREALGVMRVSGIGVVDLPRTPVRLLALAARLPSAVSRPVLRRAVGGGRGGKMPSLHVDLRSGRGRTEVEYLHGAVVRHGERSGVPTPVNRALTETLRALTLGEIPLGAYERNPRKLIAAASE